MNKKFVIILLVSSLFLAVAAALGIWFWQNDKYKEERAKIDQEITTTEAEIAKIEEMKDDQGYVPSDVVKNFINEVKNSSSEKAKLYLTKELATKDPFVLSGFDKEFDKISIQETTQEVMEGTATVNINGFWPDEDSPFEKTFSLIKEENVWKISEIQGVE